MFIGGFEKSDLVEKDLVDMVYFSKANSLIKNKNSYKDFYELIDKAQKLSEEVPVGIDLENFDTPRVIEKF